ncbi:MAG: DivIVA domain-containing protein [Solirubrobacteraceae bacterium]
MALDREQIERKDFPIGRRGYDPTEVDAHLTGLAAQVDELKRATRRRTETVAATASEQVRTIVEAAESNAAQIQRQAEADAQEIRGEASADANAARAQARSRAREYVGKVSESTVTMLERLEALQNELDDLIESLRAGGTRLNEGLRALETQLEEVRSSAAPRAQFAAEPPTLIAVGAPEPEPVAASTLEPEPVATTPLEPGPVATTVGAPQSGPLDDSEDARLIALNMALNGSSREDTERYLAANFALHDRHELIEQVYASVES